MPIKVTFDSNVWRLVVDSSKNQKNPNIHKYSLIREKIISGEIIPFISETMFSLEGIERKNRKVFFGSYEGELSFSEICSGNTEKMTFVLGPNLDVHPGNNPTFKHYLEKAIEIGFKILKNLRTAMIVNPDIKEEYFQPYPDNNVNAYINKLGEIDKKMNDHNCGMIHIENIGNKYIKPNEGWVKGLDNAGTDEDINITKAIAEWAAGDSVAMHIAYGIDYFLRTIKPRVEDQLPFFQRQI